MEFSDAFWWILDSAALVIGHIGAKSSFPQPLAPEEEQAQIERAANGDADARRVLVEHNLRLVAHIAKKYAGSGIDADDLVSVGTIGLMKAVSTFRPEAGRLATYASRCIENEILMQLRAGKKLRGDISLSDPVGADKEGNRIHVLDLLGTDPGMIPDEVETRIESGRAMRLIPKVLTGREQKVVFLRYGLIDGVPRAQHEVAAVMGISRSYVSRIEKKALEKLRAAFFVGNGQK